MKFLVVDDDPTICRALSRLLRQHAVDSIEFYAAAGALEWARTNAFDAAILDHPLPDMDGIELGRRLLRARPAVPILLLKADPDAASPAEGDAAVMDIRKKPWGRDEISRFVDRVRNRAGSDTPG